MNKNRNLFSRDEMLRMNVDILKRRGVEVSEIAEIAFLQQTKWNDKIDRKSVV